MLSLASGMRVHRTAIADLDTWLAAADDISELHSFARGIRRDYTAVRNGLSLPLSRSMRGQRQPAIYESHEDICRPPNATPGSTCNTAPVRHPPDHTRMRICRLT